MPRETARAKADRLLVEGRLVIVEVSRSLVVARVRGEGAIHQCGWQGGNWHCSCPVRTDQCSHLHAVRRVVAVDLEEQR